VVQFENFRAACDGGERETVSRLTVAARMAAPADPTGTFLPTRPGGALDVLGSSPLSRAKTRRKKLALPLQSFAGARAQVIWLAYSARLKPCPGTKRFTCAFLDLRIHLYLLHHAGVLVIEDVAVVDKGSRNFGIAEVHAYCNAGIGTAARPVRNRKGVIEFRIL
jgi:hypothetical protein